MVVARKICVGAIVGAHGVRGLVRLRSFTDDPESIFEYSPVTDEAGSRTFKLHCQSVMKDHYVVTIEGVADRETAEALRGTKLFIDRALLPATDDQSFYESDLIGLVARDAQGQDLGKVEAVHDFGAGSFLEIKPPGGGSFMLPFTDAFVPTVDVTAGFVGVVIPEGWLSSAKEREVP